MTILNVPWWRRIAGLAAGVPLAATGTVLAVPEQAAAATAPALREFDLRRGPDRGAPIRALDGRLHHVGADAVLGSSGGKRLRGGCGKAAGVPAQSLVYCFDKADSATRQWVPQGVTTISDAEAAERLAGGSRPLLVSWHGGGRVKVTFVDPDRRTYRHVLLVYPTMKGKKPTFTDVDIHAGGIAWYGDKLYVADTHHGLREFDTRLIFDLRQSKAGSTRGSGRVGLHGGKYHGHGYRYVMPQTGSWKFAQGWGGKCRGSGPLRMSWVAIDRTTWRHVLIAGEWCRPKGPRGRVVTWPVQALNGTRTVRADWAAPLPYDRLQGAVRANGHWWFTQGLGKKRGRLFMTRREWWGWGGVTYRTISYGPEDLSCYRGQHRIWTVAEYAHKRALWSFPAAPCR
ncbi:hypothetical protein [Actinomadura sp. 7K534]|uniref:hypothetical protein n=1 Tax=Actinomadura sp. 7K534 TaxID=2530366 RepID=UPI001047D92E|nr:hypothetical protein [Actinomadura sp. 7K534]TDB87157.1 hypothetical protein E1266_33175 [Actinomadura sp. 7K534]